MGKRREPRIQMRLQVRMAGVDASGRPLLQMVTTQNISCQGARLDGIQGAFKPGEIISVSYNNNKARFRVCWMGDTGTARAGQMGVESVDPAKCIWVPQLCPRQLPIPTPQRLGNGGNTGVCRANWALSCICRVRKRSCGWM